MEIAVIKTGGKQYKVKVGDIIKVEKLQDSKKIEFTDLLNNKKVAATLVSEGKSKKVLVTKFNSKKRYQRNKGHRQNYSQIKIESIA